MKKMIIFFIYLLCANISFADDKSDLLNHLVAVFNTCKEVDVRKRPYFFSRSFLAYRLGAILDRNQNDLTNTIVVSKNIINICSQVDQVNRFALEGSDDEPVLKIFYTKPKESDEKTLSLGFVKEDGLWLIAKTEECCVKLGSKVQ